MSLILDALKKSEAERHRGQVPNVLSPLPALPDHAHSRKKTNTPWIITVAFLLLVLIAGYFYTRTRDAAPASTAGVIATQALPTTDSISPAIPVSTAVPANPVPVDIPREKPARPVAEPDVMPSIPAQAAASPVSVQTPATMAVEPAQENSVASMADMPADQRQQLPALKLSMHVYSTDPGKRFAIIDGQRVNEGGVIGNAVVEKIRQDGVVLSVQGQSYLLPRP